MAGQEEEQQQPHPADPGAEKAVSFLPALVAAIQRVHAEQADAISTEVFAVLMDKCAEFFDFMGAVLHAAKHDLATKTASLHHAAPAHPTLAAVVAADVAAGRATVKDSCTRNLHRLVTTLKFVRLVLAELAGKATCTVREAVKTAYSDSLGPLHPYVVRTAVWASLYLLPSREHFISQLGETEEAARRHSLQFAELSQEVERRVEKLFEGITMPKGQPTEGVLSSLWGGKGEAAPATS